MSIDTTMISGYDVDLKEDYEKIFNLYPTRT